MKRVWVAVLIIVSSSIVLPSLAFLTPLATEDQSRLALYSMTALLNVGVAVLYLQGLKGFKYQFRVGYWYMSAAMLLYAIGVVCLPIFDTLRIQEGGTVVLPPIFLLTALPFFLFFILYYLGVRKIAGIMGLKGLLLSLPIVGGGALAVGIIAAFIPLPAVDNGANVRTLHLIVGIVGGGLSLVAITMTLLFRLMKRAGVLYRPALRWNFFGFLAFFIAQIVDPSAFLPPGHWYVKFGTTVPFLLTVACFIKAAVEFNRIPYREQHVQVGMANAQAGGNVKTSVDIVTSLSSFVSDPRAIDTNLDRLRVITANLKPGEHLAEAQQVEIANLYKIIEDYLVQREQARTYTYQDLRQLVDIQYRGSVDEPAFWRQFDLLTATQPNKNEAAVAPPQQTSMAVPS